MSKQPTNKQFWGGIGEALWYMFIAYFFSLISNSYFTTLLVIGITIRLFILEHTIS